MARLPCCIVALVWFSGGTLSAQEICAIPGNWDAPQLRRIVAAEARASSVFMPEAEQYQPHRATDGQRSTKWVADVAPTESHAQWIVLELPGMQTVNAVAVFGERTDNDGILDAEIQVFDPQPKDFRTTARTASAQSASWLATFPPTQTTAIRLLITRSSGPTSHTDVYEVEVYGPPMSAAELETHAAASLQRSAETDGKIATLVSETGLGSSGNYGLSRLLDSARQDRIVLSEQLSRWDSLSEAERRTLAEDADRLDTQLRQLLRGVDGAAGTWPGRLQDLAAVRKTAELTRTTGQVRAVRDGDTLGLMNHRVSISLHEKEGTWDATWLGDIDAAVRRVRFAVVANQEDMVPAGVTGEAVPFTDAIGSGLELRQSWGDGVHVVRSIRLYDGRGAIVISAEITNHTQEPVAVGTAKLIDLSSDAQGWWHFLDLMQMPSAVGYPHASPPCQPAVDSSPSFSDARSFGSSGVLAFARPGLPGGLTVGALSAQTGSPQVQAQFQLGQGGTSLGATMHVGESIPAGATLAVDPVWISVEDNGFAALEQYADAVAALASSPIRRGANSLWCSWYPIRMGITEEIVLEHAAIAAQHFAPLGLDVIQLDHGWQRGDICGDWFPNERFPHGLKWLAQQLQSRYGLKLGLWIAPTNAAFTSELFREHPEWMMKNAEGKPASIGTWYWVPNPEMTLIDAAHPAAEQWIRDTFARLSAEGASYYKIDFIAGSPSLRRAMAAIRQGAGADAWIRYCQTPPLLSVGLANSAYIGDDTGDAGLENWMQLERVNAPLLASSYWVNDRLYHREVCDMSVGMKASVEEARFKLSLMTLSGCSISLSDDFRTLELPRIRMMQQCLPPGNPPSRPIDLFERERPSLWHMHCETEWDTWDVVGVFNFENEVQHRSVEFSSLGLPADTDATVFEFWEEKYLGTCRDRVTVELPPATARILLIHRQPTQPSPIATNMHVLGGYHEVTQLTWNQQDLTLSGRLRRMPGTSGRVYIYVPVGFRPVATSLSNTTSMRHERNEIWSAEIAFDSAEVELNVPFEKVDP